MTIDTTRLRADAEAVRDAGARVVQTRDAGGPAFLAAHDDLRTAKAALYRDAPPDGIIVALLDEVEQLRARVGRLRQGLDDVIEAVSDGITAPADEARRALELDETEEGSTR